jgi:hypothetical protein
MSLQDDIFDVNEALQLYCDIPSNIEAFHRILTFLNEIEKERDELSEKYKAAMVLLRERLND